MVKNETKDKFAVDRESGYNIWGQLRKSGSKCQNSMRGCDYLKSSLNFLKKYEI